MAFLSQPTNRTSLALNEVEVSLFGPGYGESILIGSGSDWIIVDSCVNANGRPAAISYLESLGVDPSVSVRYVVATHWHDDHIRGLSDTVAKCTTAEVLCSDALKPEEFFCLVQLKDASKSRTTLRSPRMKSGVQEFADILHILETRKNLGQKGSSLRLVGADRRIWQRAASGTAPAVELWSLSPSDPSKFKAYSELASLFQEAKTGSITSRVRSMSPNHVAVALWLNVGNDAILLGSDLEEKNGVQGWSAILASAGRPTNQASLFKVAHHGSKNAHHDDVWTKLLQTPIAILTRFEKGSVSLPTTEDVARIKPLSLAAYVTSDGSLPRPKRIPVVEKTIRETAKKIKAARLPMGHVRLRTTGSGWQVDLSGAARAL